MRKAELIKEISIKTDIERKMVETIIQELITSFEEHVSHNETVSLNRFGTFIIKRREARMARNIAKNKLMKLPPRNVPAFRPSKYFLEKVRKNVKDEVHPAK
jgi:DNA-binding protein HU-beta